MSDNFSHIKWEYITRLWNNDLKEKDNIDIPHKEIKTLFKDYFHLRRAASTAFLDEEIDVEKAWTIVRNKTASSKVLPLWKNMLRYAAIVIPIIISTGLLWKYFPAEEKVAKVQPTSIVPGDSQAELFLASGEKIFIGKEFKSFEINQLGTKIFMDSLDCKLRYEKGASVSAKNVEYNTLKVPKGGEFYLELADGSKVWLNSESILRYPVNFRGNKREVFLEGEGFFDIAHDKSKPFYVSANKVKVKVLGTRFNVSAYPDDESLQTTLVKGSVEVNNAGTKMVLSPGYQYSLSNITKTPKVRRVDTDVYTSWIDGKFYFKGFTFEKVVKKLERWYDFEMFYLNEEIKYMKFRGVINKHEPIDKMLRKLEKTTDIKFRIKGNIIIAEKVHK